MIAILLFVVYGLACKGGNGESIEKVKTCPSSRTGGNLTYYVEQLMEAVSSLAGHQIYKRFHIIISNMEFPVPPKVHDCIYRRYNQGSREHTFVCSMTFPLALLNFTVKMGKIVDEDDFQIMLRNSLEGTISKVNASALTTVKDVISGFKSVKVEALKFPSLGRRTRRKMSGEETRAVAEWRQWALFHSGVFASEAFARSYHPKCIFHFDGGGVGSWGNLADT